MEGGENFADGTVHPLERTVVERLRIAVMPEASDFRIVKVRHVRNVEMDERQPDGWVGRIAPAAASSA